MPGIRTLAATALVVCGLALVACGGGPETVTEDVPVTDQSVETEVETDVVTDVETESEGGGGGDDQDAGDCPPGEVLSAPGNKCRPADDSDDGE